MPHEVRPPLAPDGRGAKMPRLPLALLVVAWSTAPAASTADARPDGSAPEGAAAGEVDSRAADLAAPEDRDDAETLTLGTILQTAVRQSPALELARIDVAIADARALEAAGIDDWLLAATGEWRSSRIEPVEGEPFQTTETDVVDLDVDLSRQLPTGGLFGLTAGGEFSQTTSVLEIGEEDGEPVREESQSEAVRGSILARLEQPLLAGRGRDAARGELRQREVELEAAELELRADATDIIRDLIQNYWELGFARRELEIRESSLELAEERRRITEAGVEEGAIAPSELLAVDQAIATRNEEIEEARLGVTQRSLDLRRLSGLPIDPQNVDVAVGAPVSIDERDLDLSALIERAHQMSPELAALRTRGEGAEIEVEVTENGLMPRLDASFSFGPTGSSDSVSETARQIAALEGYEVGASLTYEHALGRRADKGAHAAARGRLAEATIGIAEAEQQVAAAVVEAARTAEAAHRRIEISEEAIELARRNIEAEEARFDLGQATNFDVLERQEELEEARLRHARAGMDYLAALTQLEALTGDLLERYGITFEDR